MNDDPNTIGKADRYRMVLETRNMEVQLFWDRSNFYLALNSAIAVGFFALTNPRLALPLAVLGFLSSLLWLMANLGSKFWQTRWEEKLRQVEKEDFPDLKLFSQELDEVRGLVESNLSRAGRGWHRRILHWAILQKPSVSSTAVYLSFVFCLFWLLFGAMKLA